MATQARLSEIADLVTQWELLAGYAVQDIPQWAINDMADNKFIDIANLYDVGQYMQHFVGSQPWQIHPAQGMPGQWAWFGMSATEYQTKLEAYDSTFMSLTGQNVPADLVDQALRQHQGTMTGAQFSTWLLNQASVKNTYGWLRFGLDFQQFQQRKLDMQSAFGTNYYLSDAQAVAQLTYLHAAQGANVSAAVQPTLTQVERKQVSQGPAQSEVR